MAALVVGVLGLACMYLLLRKAKGCLQLVLSPLALVFLGLAASGAQSVYLGKDTSSSYTPPSSGTDYRCLDKDGAPYQLLSRQVVKGGTEIDLKILVKASDSPEQVRAKLLSVYSDTKCDSDFSFGPPATHLWVHAFLSEDEARGSFGNWVGLLRWPGSGIPDIQIKTEWLAALQGKSTPKTEMLPLDTQQKIYRQIVAGEREITRQINRELPLSIPGNVKKNTEMARSVLEAYRLQLAQEHGISLKTLHKIIGRGVKEDWPIP